MGGEECGGEAGASARVLAILQRATPAACAPLSGMITSRRSRRAETRRREEAHAETRRHGEAPLARSASFEVCVHTAGLLQGSERQRHAAGAAGKQRVQCRILRETRAAAQRRESDSE